MTPFQEAAHRDATLCRMLSERRSYEEIIVQLVKEKNDWFNKYLEADSLAPKKIQSPEGVTFVWHCPDELIPFTPV